MPTKVDAQISVKCAQMPLVLDGVYFLTSGATLSI